MPSERMHPFDLPIQRILVDLETRLPPWMKLVTTSDDPAFARLTHEIIAFADLVNPTHKERLVRRNIIERLQSEVRKVWPAATIVPIGSYAQELYTSSSDMDLFVSLPDIPESLEHLETLYRMLNASPIVDRGTLNIVRGARVPIIKYIDSHGSGIQVDVSMNNVSATSSTRFVQHHLSESPVLRPLTMVLKQWLFQRKMNEVYTRGGLSSYALFLLVLTVVQQHNLASVCPPDELIGRYLLQFLRQWGAPTAFAQMIRPLKGLTDKLTLSWEDTYQPFSLCIQDPVNEENLIGRQTFSIRDIQQEWQLSLNALSVAINEYAMNINGGKEKSLLASIVGLTTREYESRKQINGCQIPNRDERSSSHVPVSVQPTKLVSPPPELNPIPNKRYKFRNMLTRDGGLVDNEEVKVILARGQPWGPHNAELLDLSDANPTTEEQADARQQLTTVRSNTNVELLQCAQMSGSFASNTKLENPNPNPSTASELLNFEVGTFERSAQENLQTVESLSSSQTFNMSPSSIELEAAQIAFSPSPTLSTPPTSTISSSILARATPEIPSSNPFSPLISDRLSDTLNVGSSSLLDTPPPQPTSAYDVLLDLQGIPSGSMGTWNGLPNLSQPLRPFALGDLQGLEFTEYLSPSYIGKTKIDPFRIPNDTYSALTSSTNAFSESIAPDPLESEASEEALVFQGRHSRKSTPDIPTNREIVHVDPAILDRAFRIFTLEGTSQKS